MDRYLVTVCRPSAAGKEVTDNVVVLATSPKAARSLALNLYRRKHDLHSSIMLFSEEPVRFDSAPEVAW